MLKRKSRTRTAAALLTACLLGLVACTGDAAAPAQSEAPAAGGSEASSAPAEGASGTAGASPADAAGEAPAGQPDTWIADRTVVVQAYIDDVGYSLPGDVKATPVMKEFKARTGIDLDVQYTPGDDDLAVMTTQLAAGTIPDVILSYLDNSSRPEFNVLNKAAREGLLADVAPFIQNSQVYKKYLEPGYLPNDTNKNVMFREEFGGSAYLVHLQVPREDTSQTFEPDMDYIGGMYIQKSIADSLSVDPREIRTKDQLYDLLVQIKNGGFTDLNGTPVYPLGPKFWGGSSDALRWIANDSWWGGHNGFYNKDTDGVIKHEAETPYAMQTVNFVRKLLAEGLINPEFFTMDATRAEEVSKSHNSAIIGDVHNFTDLMIAEGDQWLPVGPLNDYTGDNATIAGGKTGYCVWAISAAAENPGEIFKFFDYAATYEGQLLASYGIEGEHYDLVDGFPVLKPEISTLIANGESETLWEMGAGFGGEGSYLFDLIRTDVAPKVDFGEAWPGAGSENSAYEKPFMIAEYSPLTYRLVEGLPANAYLAHEGLEMVNTQMSLLNYPDTLVQAIYTGSDAEAQAIIDSFVEQLKSAGLEQFREYLTEIDSADAGAVKFY